MDGVPGSSVDLLRVGMRRVGETPERHWLDRRPGRERPELRRGAPGRLGGERDDGQLAEAALARTHANTCQLLDGVRVAEVWMAGQGRAQLSRRHLLAPADDRVLAGQRSERLPTRLEPLLHESGEAPE